MVEQHVGEIIDDMGFGRFNWIVLFVIGMVWLMEGIEVTLISLVAPRLQCEWNISNYQSAILTAAVFVGMGVGAALWGWLADRHGRKKILIISSAFILVFALLTAAATNFASFVAIRLIVGIGIGGIASAICYLVEFSTTNHRARVVIAAQFFFAFGNVFAALISYLAMNKLGWKAFVVLCVIPIPFTMVILPWLPESVRYLQNTGDTDRIMKILESVSKSNKVPFPDDVEITCEESPDKGNLKALLNRAYCQELVILTILWIMAWWSYYGVILLNTKILQQRIYPADNSTITMATKSPSDCHILNNTDYLQNMTVVFGEFPGLIFFILVIERIGRKKSLMIAYFATSLCFFTLAFPLSYKGQTIVMFLARAASTTLPQILYVFTTEIFPTTVRNTALGFCFGIARCALAILPFFVDLLVKVSHVVLVVFLAIASFGCTFLCILLPETTGMDLMTS